MKCRKFDSMITEYFSRLLGEKKHRSSRYLDEEIKTARIQTKHLARNQRPRIKTKF